MRLQPALERLDTRQRLGEVGERGAGEAREVVVGIGGRLVVGLVARLVVRAVVRVAGDAERGQCVVGGLQGVGVGGGELGKAGDQLGRAQAIVGVGAVIGLVGVRGGVHRGVRRVEIV